MRRISLLIAVVALVAPLFAANNAIPTVNQPLFPSSVKPGSAAFTLMVDGSAFAPGAVVNWNGVPLTTRFVNRSRLRATVPAAKVAAPGTATVTVSNPAPGGGVSNGVFFTVTTPTPSLTFAPGASLTVGTQVMGVVVADLNGDGMQDLAVLNEGAEYTCPLGNTGVTYVSTFMGKGDGMFTPSGSLQLDCQQLSNSLYSISTADVNHDGYPDLVVSFTGEIENRIVAVYLGNGDGTFASQPSEVNDDAAFGNGTAVPGDFNGDGNMDLAIEGGDFGLGIFVLEGNGAGAFPTVALTGLNPAADGEGSSWLISGDFNNDGILDLIQPLTDSFPPLPAILLGNGDGTFTGAPSQPSGIFSALPVLGDFDGDGNLDIISGSMMLLGHGNGTFAETSQPDISGSLTGDLNGDGKLDLTGNGAVYLGNGDGTFQTGLDISYSGSQVGIGDFNGDGRLDLVTLNGPNTITLLIQSPATTLSAGSIGFGQQTVGSTSASRRLYLKNTGSAVMQLSNIVISGDFAETSNCGTVVLIDQSCYMDVVFQPTAKGLRTGSIALTDNAAGSPQKTQLNGTGVAWSFLPGKQAR